MEDIPNNLGGLFLDPDGAEEQDFRNESNQNNNEEAEVKETNSKEARDP